MEKYTIQDLMMIKPMMSKLGLNPNDKTNMISIYEALINNSTVNSKFIGKLDSNKLNKIDDFEIPFLYALKDLNSNRNTASINNYAMNNLNIDLSKDIYNFELSVSLLNELSYINETDINNILYGNEFERDSIAAEIQKNLDTGNYAVVDIGLCDK